MTQLAGKTTTIEALIHRSGLRAIVFKTKRGEKGFEAAGKNLPMFFQERGDWQYVASLMEATLREKLKFERSWIIKITKDKYRTEHPLKEVYERLTDLLKSGKLRGIDESIYTNLQAYLDIVLPKLAKLPTTNKINIDQGVNVMDLEMIAESPEIQALIIRSVMEHILEKESNIIVVVPECWKFLPQGKSTPVKVFFESFIRQGAAIGNFLWLDTQDLGGMDKTELRSVNNWILGRQRESNEVQRTLDQIPLPKNKKPSELDIMNLKVGHFYAACGDEVKLTYVLPAGVPEQLGIRIAKGEVKVEEAVKVLDQLRDRNHSKESDEEMWEKRCLELEKQVRDLEYARKSETELLKLDVKELKEQLTKVTSLSEKQNEELAKLHLVSNFVQPLEVLVKTIMKETGSVYQQASPARRINGISIQGEEVTVTVEKPTEKTLEFNTSTNRGRIMYVVVVERKGELTSEKQIVDIAVEHGWTLNHNNTAPELGKLVGEGLLIKEPTTPISYRPPTKVKFEVKK
jgi:polyhydroxyalkanoate synthesis regulator phasin